MSLERKGKGNVWRFIDNLRAALTKFHPPPGRVVLPPCTDGLYHGRGGATSRISSNPHARFSPFLHIGPWVPSAGDPSPRANCPDSATPFCPLPRATRSHVFIEELGRPITSCPRCVECHHHHLGVPVVVSGPFWPLSVKAVCMCANPSGYTAPPAAPSTPGSKKKNKKKKTNGSNNTTTTAAAAAAANKPEPVAVDALGNDGAGSPEVEDEVDETLDSVCIHIHHMCPRGLRRGPRPHPDQC